MRTRLLLALLAGALAAVPAAAQQWLGGCWVLPTSNFWNTPVDTLPVASNSAAVISFIDAHGGDSLHPDFGSGLWQGAPIGIPAITVPDNQALVPIDFDSLGGWPDESDPGPYPIPDNAPIEGGPSSDGDRHVLVLRQGSCILYELYYSWPEGQNGCVVPGATPGWCGLSGAVYDLGSNALRPETWTSADAAGLPILPGLARYLETASGEIRHALRFTVSVTLDYVDAAHPGYVWPARHEAGSTTNLSAPPMGLRFRLKASYDISGFSPQTQVILRALKKYGMIVADNGSNWFISGMPSAAPPNGWDDDQLAELGSVPGNQFEVVDVSSIFGGDADSGATTHLFSDGFDGGTTNYWSSVAP
jgi:hypothetical protein